MQAACAIGGGGSLLYICQGSGLSTALRKARTTACILSRPSTALSAAMAYVGGAAGSFGCQPLARAALKILPAPVCVGGEPLISYQRSSVMTASYLDDFADHSSNMLKPRCEPPLAANIANAQLVHSSQLRLSFGMNAIALASSSRSTWGVPSNG